MSEPVLYAVDNGIAVIRLNNHPVNSLGIHVRNAMQACFDRAFADPDVKAIVLASTKSVFSAGADISEFDSADALSGSRLPDFCNELDDANKLIVAAINGAALGGGLELAMAADYRIALPAAKLSLPEIKLGIMPGAGGTQRLPRLAGPEVAATMILTGDPISAEDAEGGLVDRVYRGDGDFITAAVDYARELVQASAPLRSCADTLVGREQLPPGFYDALTQQYVARKRGGVLGAKNAIKAIEAACEKPFAEGIQVEHALFLECMGTAEARAAQHLFFAERKALKIPGVNPKTPVRSIKTVAVVGAGTMGSGIAMNFVEAGIPVTILDMTPENLDRGINTIREQYQRALNKGRITEAQLEHRMSLFQGTVDYADLADVDLVIEAVFENMAVKQQVFRELDKVCKPGAILASNTSTLDLNAVATITTRPEDVVGLHFFSPANLMKLLEIVRGEKTADDVLMTVIRLAQKIRKVPVVVGVCYGFVGNRMVAPYSREAFRILLEGMTPEQVDGTLTRFGMAMGAVSMADLAGIDVGCMAAEANQASWSADKTYQALQFRLRDLGRLGQKTGRGVYSYKGRQKISDPETGRVAQAIAAEHGIQQRDISEQEIRERCLFMLINEGARILEEGIASRASDIDLIYVHGYGFPAWLGGPMHYADELGLDKVLAAIEHYGEALDDYGKMWFKPAPLLQRLVSEGKSFKDVSHNL